MQRMAKPTAYRAAGRMSIDGIAYNQGEAIDVSLHRPQTLKDLTKQGLVHSDDEANEAPVTELAEPAKEPEPAKEAVTSSKAQKGKE